MKQREPAYYGEYVHTWKSLVVLYKLELKAKQLNLPPKGGEERNTFINKFYEVKEIIYQIVYVLPLPQEITNIKYENSNM